MAPCPTLMAEKVVLGADCFYDLSTNDKVSMLFTDPYTLLWQQCPCSCDISGKKIVFKKNLYINRGVSKHGYDIYREEKFKSVLRVRFLLYLKKKFFPPPKTR